MTKHGEMQRESTEQDKVDEAKPTDNSYGDNEEALSSSDIEPPNDHASTHSQPENSTVPAHKEYDVNDLSELSDCSNIQSDVDYLTASEDSNSASIDSETVAEKLDTDDSANKIVQEPPEGTTENTLAPVSNSEDTDTRPSSSQDKSDDNNRTAKLLSVEDSSNASAAEPSETKIRTVSDSDIEIVKECPSSIQDTNDDILSSEDPAGIVAQGSADEEIENASNSDAENLEIKPSGGQEESDGAVSSVGDAGNMTGGGLSETEMKDEVPNSNSDVENVKVGLPSDQDEKNDALLSVEDSTNENLEEPLVETYDAPPSNSDGENVPNSACVNSGEPQELETRKSPISHGNVKIEACPSSELDGRTDIAPSIEDPADMILGEPSEVEMKDAATLDCSGMDVDEPASPTGDESANTADGVSNLHADNKPGSDKHHEIDNSKLPAENNLADSTLSSSEHCESASNTNVDDGKTCAISDSSDHKNVKKDEGDVDPVTVNANSSSSAVEHDEPAINSATGTESVTTGSMTNSCGTTISTAPSLKGTSAKYACVGSALKVAVPTKCIHNANSSTVLSTGQHKRAEKISIKNVSKASKIFKVSNLSYKIKPVLKSAASLDCPIIYVGEPAFVDIEDFTDVASEQAQNDGSVSFKTQTSDPDWATSIPTAYVTSLLQSGRVVPLSQGANQNPSMISLTNPSGRVPYHQKCSEYSFPPYITAQPASSDKLLEKKAPIVNAVPQWDQKQNSTFQHGTAFRIVARPASKPVTSDTQKSVANKIDLVKIKPILHKPPIIAKSVTKPMAVVKKQASGSVVSIAMVKPVSQAAMVTSVKTKPTLSSQATTKNKTLLATTSMKVAVPMKSLGSPAMKVNIYPASTMSKRIPPKALPIKPKFTVSKPVVSTSPVKPVAGKTVASKNDTAVYKNTSTVYIKTLSNGTPKSMLAVNPSTKVTAKEDLPEKSRTYSSTFITQNKGLRAGVEVAFEDGVRHFITNLNKITHMDDEPVNSWSELKRGTKVAAAWTDGQIYDATVIASYIPTSKKMQPVVSLETLPIKASKVKVEPPKPKSTPKSVPTQSKKNIGCTRCRKVFTSIIDFREHQRLKCNSTGVIVPNSASKVTDEMILGIMKEKKHFANSDSKTPATKKQVTASPSYQSNLRSTKQTNTKDTSKSSASQSYSKAAKQSISKDVSPSTQSYSKSAKRSNLKGASTSQSPQSNPRSTKCSNCIETEEPSPKKAKICRSATKSSNDEAIFKTGTKFLHRWQLDGGESRWYQGEVQSIISNKGSFLNWEFAVSYKGEDDNYVLKLFEDFPTDIRIIGKM